MLVAGDAQVDLASALDELAARGVDVVLTEGGPRLLSELIEADLLDELCLTLAPVMGAIPSPSPRCPSPALRRFELASALTDDGHLFLRYLTVRP